MYNIGKHSVYTKLTSNINKLSNLSVIGISNDFEEALQAARSFVLILYGNKKIESGQYCNTLDELRYELASTTDRQVACLPHIEDAFKQHDMRAILQAIIWYHSHEPNPGLWDPVGNGWKHGMYTGEAAPAEVRDLTYL